LPFCKNYAIYTPQFCRIEKNDEEKKESNEQEEERVEHDGEEGDPLAVISNMLEACSRGRFNRVIRLFKEGESAGCLDSNGVTPIAISLLFDTFRSTMRCSRGEPT
jgi:hypothetical protein